MTRTDRWGPRRVVTRFPEGAQISREQIGHEAYRVQIHDGIRLVHSTDYSDGAEAQRAWIDAQVEYLETLRALIPPPLPERPSRIVAVDEDDVPEGDA